MSFNDKLQEAEDIQFANNLSAAWGSNSQPSRKAKRLSAAARTWTATAAESDDPEDHKEADKAHGDAATAHVEAARAFKPGSPEHDGHNEIAADHAKNAWLHSGKHEGRVAPPAPPAAPEGALAEAVAARTDEDDASATPAAPAAPPTKGQVPPQFAKKAAPVAPAAPAAPAPAKNPVPPQFQKKAAPVAPVAPAAPAVVPVTPAPAKPNPFAKKPAVPAPAAAPAVPAAPAPGGGSALDELAKRKGWQKPPSASAVPPAPAANEDISGRNDRSPAELGAEADVASEAAEEQGTATAHQAASSAHLFAHAACLRAGNGAAAEQHRVAALAHAKAAQKLGTTRVKPTAKANEIVFGNEETFQFVVNDSYLPNETTGLTRVQIAPYGDWPHSGGLQRFRREDAEEIVRNFNAGGALANGEQRPGLTQRLATAVMGLPWLIGHPDHPDFRARYTDGGAYGRIKSFEIANDGLYAQVKFNRKGKDLVNEETYHGHSVNWRVRQESPGVWRPFDIKSVGFTNEPNIPVQPVTHANEGEEALAVANGSPDQPRDEQGRFAAGGGGSGDKATKEDLDRTVGNEVSLSDLRRQLQDAVADDDRFEREEDGAEESVIMPAATPMVSDMVAPDEGESVWQVIVQCGDGEYYALGFTVQDGRPVLSDGDLTCVEQRTEYAPVPDEEDDANEGTSAGAVKGWETRRGLEAQQLPAAIKVSLAQKGSSQYVGRVTGSHEQYGEEVEFLSKKQVSKGYSTAEITHSGIHKVPSGATVGTRRIDTGFVHVKPDGTYEEVTRQEAHNRMGWNANEFSAGTTPAGTATNNDTGDDEVKLNQLAVMVGLDEAANETAIADRITRVFGQPEVAAFANAAPDEKFPPWTKDLDEWKERAGKAEKELGNCMDSLKGTVKSAQPSAANEALTECGAMRKVVEETLANARKLVVDSAIKTGVVTLADKGKLEMSLVNDFAATLASLVARKPALQTTSAVAATGAGTRSTTLQDGGSNGGAIRQLVNQIQVEASKKGVPLSYEDAWASAKRQQPGLFANAPSN